MAGGYNGAFTGAERYDPARGTWSVTGNLNIARQAHTATMLPNGKVLVAGGFGSPGPKSSAELYDPASGRWNATGSLTNTPLGRQFHTATLLPNGKVLVAAGFNNFGPLSSADWYDPTSGTWSATGSLTTARASSDLRRCCLTAMCWWQEEIYSIPYQREMYDPASGTWSSTETSRT